MKALYTGLLIGVLVCAGILGKRNAELQVKNQTLLIQLEEQRISWGLLQVNCVAPRDSGWLPPTGDGFIKADDRSL